MLESQLLRSVPVFVQSFPLQKWQQLPAWGLQMLLRQLLRQLPRRQAILLVSFAISPTVLLHLANSFYPRMLMGRLA